jgi:hypothetical protein
MFSIAELLGIPLEAAEGSILESWGVIFTGLIVAVLISI